MIEYGLPVLSALFLWWLSTGVVIYLDGLPRHTFRWSMLGATVVAVASLIGLATSSHDASTAGAYLAFACGLLVWGWQAASFYLGYVTGPRKQRCPEGCAGLPHFGHAIQTSLHHELAIVASALLLLALTWGAPNQVGLWTFLILSGMHLSAKLNVFLGVRNVSQEFLPEHLRFLEGFFGKRGINPFFPVSVTASTAVAAVLIAEAAGAEGGSFEATQSTLLATLMVLAILEHWFMVLPLPAEQLWSWSLRSRGVAPSEDVATFRASSETAGARGAEVVRSAPLPAPPAVSPAKSGGV